MLRLVGWRRWRRQASDFEENERFAQQRLYGEKRAVKRVAKRDGVEATDAAGWEDGRSQRHTATASKLAADGV